MSHMWASFITVCRTSQALLTTLDRCHHQLQFYLFYNVINLQVMRELLHCVKTRGVGDLIWKASNIRKFWIRFLVHPSPSIWKQSKPSKYPKNSLSYFLDWDYGVLLKSHVFLQNPYAKHVPLPQHFASKNQCALELQTKISCKLTINVSKLALVMKI